MDSRNDNLKLQIKDLITCSICLRHFVNPKSLPCLHTFCLNCLIKLPRQTASAQALPNANVISCPQCRAIWKIPCGAEVHLRDNFIVKNLIDSMKSNEYCNSHDDEFRKNTHFCTNCAVHCCDNCASAMHQDHDCKPAQEASLMLDDRATVAATSIAGYSAKLENRLDHMHEEFVNQIKAADTKIKRQGTKLKMLVDERVAFLRQQLQSIHDKKHTEYQSNKRKLDAMEQSYDVDRVKRTTKLTEKVAAVCILEQQAANWQLANPIPTENSRSCIYFTPTAHTILSSGEFTQQPFIGMICKGSVSPEHEPGSADRVRKRKLQAGQQRSSSRSSEEGGPSHSTVQ